MAKPQCVPWQRGHLGQAHWAAWSGQQPETLVTGKFPRQAVLSHGVSNQSGNGKERSSKSYVCVKQQLLKALAMLEGGEVQEKTGKVWDS